MWTHPPLIKLFLMKLRLTNTCGHWPRDSLWKIAIMRENLLRLVSYVHYCSGESDSNNTSWSIEKTNNEVIKYKVIKTISYCRLCQLLYHCQAPPESLEHLLTRCRATSDVRDRIMPELLNTIASYSPHNSLLSSPSHITLTQFILDCSSLNLNVDTRIPPNREGFIDITRLCSSLIFAIHKERTRQMKAQNLLQ